MNKITERFQYQCTGLGFDVVWEKEEHSIDFSAHSIFSIDSNSVAEYRKKDYDDELTGDTNNAEVFLSGSTGKDGCSRIEMARQHLCDTNEKDSFKYNGYRELVALLDYIYKRAFELLEKE